MSDYATNMQFLISISLIAVLDLINPAGSPLIFVNFFYTVASIYKNCQERIMKRLYSYVSLVCFFCIAFSAFAQESRFVVVNKTSKELKRAAHRLRIPADQLKKARQTLQEATELARTLKPYPITQAPNLVNVWQRLNRPGAKTIISSFVQDLRLEAANATEPQTYTQATSTAISIMQMAEDSDYEKLQQMIQSWPDPPEAIAYATGDLRESAANGIRQNALWRLANTDPDKALELLQTSADSGEFNYRFAGQIAMGLMNSGRKDEAINLIEQTVADFTRNATDARALQAYENFVYASVPSLDPGRAAAVMDPFIAQLSNQVPSGDCSAKLKTDDSDIDLTCSEVKVLNLLRNIGMKPVLAQTTLDSIPTLKSKLDSIGGIDGFFSNGMVQYAYGASNAGQPAPPAHNPYQNSSKLIQELRGKAQSNPAYVKRKLQDVAKDQGGIDTLVTLAMMACYQDDDLASIALEIAHPMVSQVLPLERRSSVLQNLVQAYRQVEGEVDDGLLKDGFLLADQLREEQLEQSEAPDKMNLMRQHGRTSADQLEAMLVAELSKDDFESAIRYVRAMKNNSLKLMCLTQIAQVLGQSIF